MTVNAAKPRKGSFVVTLGDTRVIELLDMPRPFVTLKSMDVAAVVEKHLHV